MNRPRRFANMSIQTRLIILFLITTALIFVVNVYVYINLNQMIGRIEALYADNVSLNELSDRLKDVHDNMTQYLKTKNTESLEDYYKYEQEYKERIDSFSISATSSELKYMEKCIVDMSYTYLNITEQAVNAKRGRKR